MRRPLSVSVNVEQMEIDGSVLIIKRSVSQPCEGECLKRFDLKEFRHVGFDMTYFKVIGMKV